MAACHGVFDASIMITVPACARRPLGTTGPGVRGSRWPRRRPLIGPTSGIRRVMKRALPSRAIARRPRSATQDRSSPNALVEMGVQNSHRPKAAPHPQVMSSPVPPLPQVVDLAEGHHARRAPEDVGQDRGAAPDPHPTMNRTLIADTAAIASMVGLTRRSRVHHDAARARVLGQTLELLRRGLRRGDRRPPGVHVIRRGFGGGRETSSQQWSLRADVPPRLLESGSRGMQSRAVGRARWRSVPPGAVRSCGSR